MGSTSISPTRKDFLLSITGAALLPRVVAAQTSRRKLLIVVAHPDDEYAFAAGVYRLVRESGWDADQVTITDGESGYRYSTLAEAYYGTSLAQSSDGHARLAAIRKEEALRAGKILGIRHHYFLDQKDLGFDTDASSAGTANWDRPRIRSFLSSLLAREQYDAVFTLLPTPETHGHHRAATVLALEAVASAPAERRPLVFGVEPRSKTEPQGIFAALPTEPLTKTFDSAPALIFDRMSAFGYRNGLNYQIVVNWVIAEHKSQGLFQNDCGRHEFEQFWLFKVSGENAVQRLSEIQTAFDCSQPAPAR